MCFACFDRGYHTFTADALERCTYFCQGAQLGCWEILDKDVEFKIGQPYLLEGVTVLCLTVWSLYHVWSWHVHSLSHVLSMLVRNVVPRNFCGKYSTGPNLTLV